LPIGINEFSFSTIELFVLPEAARGSIIPIQFQYVFGDLILDTVLTLKIVAVIASNDLLSLSVVDTYALSV
jgi:hypothetical protein